MRKLLAAQKASLFEFLKTEKKIISMSKNRQRVVFGINF
jgi:hypothetical protein